MPQAKTGSSFELFHKKDGKANILTISPSVKCNYSPVNIELSDDQWNALQYHFAKMVNDKEGISKLAYVY